MGIYNKKYLFCLSVFILALRCTAETTAPPAITTASNIDITTTEAYVGEPNESSEIDSKLETRSNVTNTDSNQTKIEDNSTSPIITPLLPLSDTELNELDDLQHGGDFSDIPKTISEDDVVILPVPIDNDQQGPISEIEWIEEDEVDPDLPPLVQAMTDMKDDDDATFQGHMGVIAALFLVAFLIIGYTGFIVWRRFIEKRYGSSEILINEEDMIDPSDMKHFSL